MTLPSPLLQTLRRLLSAGLCLAIAAGPAHAQFSLGSFGSTGDTRSGSSTSTPPPAAAMGAAGAGYGAGQGVGGGVQGGMAGNSLDASPRSLNRRGAAGGSAGESADRTRTDDALGSPRSGGAQREASKPSQFQQFVEQATGRLLPIYGSELFEGPRVAYVPDGNSPAPSNYVLGPGDDVRLQVWGGVDYEGTLTIDRNGQVTIPRAGVVTLAGVKESEVETAIRSQLGKTFTNFSLNASMGRLRAVQVYVVGQAQRPGTFTLSSLSTLVNAVFASGGPNANGSMRNIELRRNGNKVTTLDLYNFIGNGDKSGDAQLQAGDVIVIPPVGPRVAVTGALDQAAIYELKGQQNTLGNILQLSGGVPTLAATAKAVVERVNPGQIPARQVQDIALDAAGLGLPLRDGDVVTLLNISPAFANAVTLQGNVAAPLRYRWFPGMKLRDLIPEKDALITPNYYQRKNLLVQSIDEPLLGNRYRDNGASGMQQGSRSNATQQRLAQNNVRLPGSVSAQDGNSDYFDPNGVALDESRTAGRSINERVRTMVDQINWDYAVIERLDREQLKTTLIPFSPGKLLMQNDESQNLVLQPGDVVTVLSQKDLKLPVLRQTRLVRLEGEVAAAGLYEIRPGETVRQLIERVGGLTPQAYVFGTALDRESVRKKQQENLDQLIRRLEQQQQSQILFQVANRPTTDAAAQATILQQQQTLARAQIESLKKLRSDGRIALELNPTQQTVAALPDLPLEDGDRIVVPATPGFVSTVGAVNNENVFIYKAGKTVAEVAKSAGLREEADKDQMFVLRADGSIVSRRDSSLVGGFFGGGFDNLALMPGDTLVVPEKLDRETTRNFVVRQLKDFTQILSQFGLGVAAIKVIRDL